MTGIALPYLDRERPVRVREGLAVSTILDGRNRYLACRVAGIPFIACEYVGEPPLGFVVQCQYSTPASDC
jgi:hypothetical protein